MYEKDIEERILKKEEFEQEYSEYLDKQKSEEIDDDIISLYLNR